MVATALLAAFPFLPFPCQSECNRSRASGSWRHARSAGLPSDFGLRSALNTIPWHSSWRHGMDRDPCCRAGR
jgi:hypothetical protein